MSNEIDKLSWKAGGEANEYSLMRDGNWLAMLRMNGEMLVPHQEWVIRRIVACANACRLIDTEIVEAVAACGGIAKDPVIEISRLTQQRDELLAAAKAVKAIDDRMRDGESVSADEFIPAYQSLDDAIAKAEDGQ